MSTVLIVVASLAAAGVAAWLFHMRDARGVAKPTACEQIVNNLFANGGSSKPDSVLLSGLLEHREDCIGDAAYVDQTRRMMTNTRRFGDARALLMDAGQHSAFTADEMATQTAWIDVSEAHDLWANGNESEAHAMRDKAMASMQDVRLKWPEWSAPYLILDEAERLSWASKPDAAGTDYFALYQHTAKKVFTGAFVRTMSPIQLAAFVFVVSVIAMFGLFAGVSGLLAMRDMAGAVTSPIGSAPQGYVEVKGTLHVTPGASPVIGSFSNSPGVWYDVETVTGSKPTRTTRERSAQQFVVRDSTGEATIEPEGMTVRTSHTAGKPGNSGGLSSSNRISERMLKEGDQAYVLGELTIREGTGANAYRTIGQPKNGKRLIVSNYSEQRLMLFEKIWLWVGISALLVATIILAWSYYQRFGVSVTPGVLS